MNIILNGEKHEIMAGQTLAKMIAKLTPSNKNIAILVNDGLIAADQWNKCILKEGDRVEILTFAGGG